MFNKSYIFIVTFFIGCLYGIRELASEISDSLCLYGIRELASATSESLCLYGIRERELAGPGVGDDLPEMAPAQLQGQDGGEGRC